MLSFHPSKRNRDFSSARFLKVWKKHSIGKVVGKQASHTLKVGSACGETLGGDEVLLLCDRALWNQQPFGLQKQFHSWKFYTLSEKFPVQPSAYNCTWWVWTTPKRQLSHWLKEVVPTGVFQCMALLPNAYPLGNNFFLPTLILIRIKFFTFLLHLTSLSPSFLPFS